MKIFNFSIREKRLIFQFQSGAPEIRLPRAQTPDIAIEPRMQDIDTLQQSVVESKLKAQEGREELSRRLATKVDDILRGLGFSSNDRADNFRQKISDKGRNYEVEIKSTLNEEKTLFYTVLIVRRFGRNGMVDMAVKAERIIDAKAGKPNGKNIFAYNFFLDDLTRQRGQENMSLDFHNGKYDFDIYAARGEKGNSVPEQKLIRSAEEANNVVRADMMLERASQLSLLIRRENLKAKIRAPYKQDF